MASKDIGGLGVASLFALNRAFMFKWVWRFITKKKSLWARVIKAIHGDDGKIGKKVNPSYPSIWLSIIQEAGVLKSQGIDILSFIKPKCGDDVQVATKLSHEDLEWSFRRKSRSGVEQHQLIMLQEKIEGCILSNTVKTRWIKEVPLKINIHAWKITNDYLPTRFNLSRRGMDIETIVCPMCNSMVESIIQEAGVLKSQGIDILSFIKPKCGDGTNTSFWNDAWKGDVAFKDLMPRLYMLENMKDVQEKIEGCILSNTQDRWTWSLEGSGDFFVSSVRKVIDAVYLPRGSVKTKWIKEVPLKVNIHAWKVTNDYLPTRFNLSRRGMDIETIVCPMCNSMVESSRHLFFSCEFSNQIMRKIMRWWELDYREINSYKAWVE
nr:RNA-directed DNA polymerase, eukaryota [Tanacetum cinerariifolium]